MHFSKCRSKGAATLSRLPALRSRLSTESGLRLCNSGHLVILASLVQDDFRHLAISILHEGQLRIHHFDKELRVGRRAQFEFGLACQLGIHTSTIAADGQNLNRSRETPIFDPWPFCRTKNERPWFSAQEAFVEGNIGWPIWTGYATYGKWYHKWSKSVSPVTIGLLAPRMPAQVNRLHLMSLLGPPNHPTKITPA